MKAKFLVPNVEFALHGFNGQIPVFPESSLESSWIVFCSQISLWRLIWSKNSFDGPI